MLLLVDVYRKQSNALSYTIDGYKNLMKEITAKISKDNSESLEISRKILLYSKLNDEEKKSFSVKNKNIQLMVETIGVENSLNIQLQRRIQNELKLEEIKRKQIELKQQENAEEATKLRRELVDKTYSETGKKDLTAKIS